MIQRMAMKPLAVVEYLPSPLKNRPNPRSPPYFLSNSKATSPFTSDAPSVDTSNPGLSSISSNPSRVPPNEPCFLESDALDRLEPSIPREKSTSEMKLVPFREESFKVHQPVTTSTFSFLPSLRFHSILRHLDTPLSFGCPERFQVSDTTSSEVEYKLYAYHFFGCYSQW